MDESCNFSDLDEGPRYKPDCVTLTGIILIKDFKELPKIFKILIL
jgi:hypothetical protein